MTLGVEKPFKKDYLSSQRRHCNGPSGLPVGDILMPTPGLSPILSLAGSVVPGCSSFDWRTKLY